MPEKVPIVDILKAELRLGNKAEDRLDWIFSFAQRDLEILGEGELLTLRNEIGAFMHGFHLPQPPPREDVEKRIEFAHRWQSPIYVDRPLVGEVELLQLDVRELVSMFLNTGDFSTRAVSGRWSPARDEFIVEGFPDKFLYQLGRLLNAFRGKIQVCKEVDCGRWFVSRRKSHDYCSRRCQSRVASRKYQKSKRQDRAQSQ